MTDSLTCPFCKERKGTGDCYLGIQEDGSIWAMHETDGSVGTCEYWQAIVGEDNLLKRDPASDWKSFLKGAHRGA